MLLILSGCEEEDNSLRLINSSINNGSILDSESGVFLRFSRKISDEEFDAETINSYSDYTIDLPDTIDVDDNFYQTDLVSFIYFIDNSNYIKLNNQPQSFIYDSRHNYVLLFDITTELFPSGTDLGFQPNNGTNILIIGDEEIQFSYDPTFDLRIVPNPYIQNSGFNEHEFLKQIRFTNLPEFAIIDIYKINGEEFIHRLIHDSSDSGNLSWDLRNYNNQEILSGFYIYRIGTDTTDSGYLNYLINGYFSYIIDK